MSEAEPRWDRDLQYGRQAELLIGEYLDWIAKGNGAVEVKRKRRLDLEFYVETECDKGRRGDYQPSGINVTEAHMWAFVIADTKIALCLPTELLRAAATHPSARPVAETDGSCPTRGKLINIGTLLQVAKAYGHNGARPVVE